MNEITLQEAVQEMVSQLEKTLARLAIVAEAELSTSNLEEKAKKLAHKLKASATLFNGLILYGDIEGSEQYSWTLSDTLPDDILVPYATLCKRTNDTPKVIKTNEGTYYAEITKGIFVNINELPTAELPTFKVKLEGNTLMAVRSDLLNKLPMATQKLLGGNND